jgi:hypothetical protein
VTHCRDWSFALPHPFCGQDHRADDSETGVRTEFVTRSSALPAPYLTGLIRFVLSETLIKAGTAEVADEPKAPRDCAALRTKY